MQRVIESLRLEKISKITKSNRQPKTTMPARGERSGWDSPHRGGEGKGTRAQPSLGEPGPGAWDPLYPSSPSGPTSVTKSIKVTHTITLG